eukprot:CAMPEP_0178393624 /NCGR_PEP_ID=MMETSP0689_2-20121128/12283_1 /TAXON_ID=160604 /ORGANISM="Amphidinium massartii, Strain CS-259" /LENGTH=471 /DNA_ID=CAMNT_0020014221 /DNA_START=30 /DNA_END=1441 /DNA_ORIENTATION=+
MASRRSRSPKRTRGKVSDDEDLRRVARKIFKSACAAVDPKTAVLNSLTLEGSVLKMQGTSLDVAQYTNILVLGAGKACMGMAEAVQQVLGDRITKGIVITKYGHAKGHTLSSKFQVFEASHPTPDEAGVTATSRLLEAADEADDKTLVLCCISGGSSSLLVAPADGISLEEMKQATKLLLGCGCPVEEKNAVLKHLSRVKGGQLTAHCQPARVWTMILSDVVGDPLEDIGSGPTVPDVSTYIDCLRILGAHGVLDSFPVSCRERIIRGSAGLLKDTPRQGDKDFTGCLTTVVAGNKTAVDAALAEAQAQGFSSLALTTFAEGEATEIVKVFTGIAKEEVKFNRPVPTPACIVIGGESTVSLPKSPGKGGRNQLMALAAALQIQGMNGVAILCGGTDGGDGPNNDSAGAVVTGSDIEEGEKLNLDAKRYLDNCDSYNFFESFEIEKFGRTNVMHLRDGPTGTNVADIVIILV